MHQAIDVALTHRNLSMDIRGSILDSCGKGRPLVNVNWVTNGLMVYWYCCRRDGMGYFQTMKEELGYE